MLRKDTVEENTFRILKMLQQDENLTGFYLVGGTALALKIGHRRSIDLDMFSPEPFDTQALTECLAKRYGFEKAFPNRISKVILQGYIENVKVDWVVNKYPFVENPKLSSHTSEPSSNISEPSPNVAELSSVIANPSSSISDPSSSDSDFWFQISDISQSSVIQSFSHSDTSPSSVIQLFSHSNASPSSVIRSFSHSDTWGVSYSVIQLFVKLLSDHKKTALNLPGIGKDQKPSII